jgi:hypothetical protein
MSVRARSSSRLKYYIEVFVVTVIPLAPTSFLSWLRSLLPAKKPLSTEKRARALIRAIDAGGLPLNAAIVNDIARQLGLEVSAKARMEDTINRIRAALER